MDIWHFIERDQENIAHLIHEMPAALPGPGVLRSRERLLADLIGELRHHAAGLAEGLYPRLRRDPGAGQLLDELAEDEATFVRALRRLQRQRTDRPDWLGQFADASYSVDQWLHRHRHELVPAARSRLFGLELVQTTEAFIRARRRSLAPRVDHVAVRLLTAGAAVSLVTAVVLLVRRFASSGGDYSGGQFKLQAEGAHSLARDRPVTDRAAAAPGSQGQNEDLRAHQERLLDEALEETFPASDPIAPKRITR